MRALLISCLVFTACTGLFTENGNAYPCNFSLPPEQRDAPCVEGDVCSINNVCTEFIYEGPRFEGPPNQPDYSLATTVKVHPGALAAPITKLARDASLRGTYFAQTSDTFAVRVTEKGQLVATSPVPADLRAPVFGTLLDPQLGRLTGAVGISNARVAYSFRTSTGDERSSTLGPSSRRVRLAATASPTFLTPEGRLEVPAFIGSTSPPFTLPLQNRFDVTGDGRDVLLVNRQASASAAMTVVLTSDGMFSETSDGGFTQLAAPNLTLVEGTLSTNAASTLVAASLNSLVLSTWQVGIENGAQTLQRAWPDCVPCRGATIELVTPMPAAAGVGVEVLCRGASSKVMVRVVGSSAAAPQDACITQTLSPTFDFTRAAAPEAAFTSAAVQRGAIIGGLAGEIWAGETLSTLLPTSLERVPLDVATVSVKANGAPVQTLIALTERYAAVLPPVTPMNQLASGFRRVDAASDFNLDEAVVITSAIHGTDGWGVLNTGVLASVKLNEETVTQQGTPLRFGRRLVTPSGQPTQRSAGGEAFTFTDGGLAAVYVAADDGLYALVNPEATLSDVPTGTADITPQLQPEPSVPIRSLALERTPLGTDGVSRARGYLVTSRNVYEWSLAGTPARWSSRLLQLAGGEPVEVWFDQPRSALGRVGYSDGTIFTLPGGFQLANPLPASASDVPAKVIDYENFGGWPVALTTTGLWAAGWQEVDGKVQNRFADGRPNRPMDWKKLSMPDGSAPWERGDDTKGRLFVQFLGLDESGTLRKFRLYLFLPEQVLILGEYARK